MTLHLLKLCVGAETVRDLMDWQMSGRADWPLGDGRVLPAHVTRQTPKRADEILSGGSLYWIIRGQIIVRQGVAALETAKTGDGKSACAIVLEPRLILTRPRAHRPFQGWRYLSAADAPADLGPAGMEGMGDASLEAELLELGLL